ncbi:hypothetical protein [Prosthecobacter dejongeii]|uniref:Uncharacterized protein n=1 Tax=Prosthecobacter dejongeii TaxID=48465 RepID=A0A7W7YQN1_9BACT|nr:hypothetical protein [Prosthecobacter dejongeii]MBB5040439.1 hypothetical protein [Prosthecobacter dejongeii]
MTLDEAYNNYGEPLYVGSKHLVWKDNARNRAVKATRPGYLTDGSVVIISQPWHEPADPSSPHPSLEETTEFMQKFGFRQVTLNDWKRVDGVMAREVKPGDFIKTKDGVVPIDVHLEDPNRHA